MEKWNLVIDVAACTNCNNCAVATQDEFAGNEFSGYSAPGAPDVRTLDITRHVRGEGSMVDVHYVPRMCNHCDDAPCIEIADGAITKRRDGIVIIDPVRAKGRRDLVDACPYGAIVWNEAQRVAQNWIFDAHLLDHGWKEPRAAQVCPTRAITALKISDEAMATNAREEGLAVLRPELGTRPRVYYRNLDPVLTHFIGGNVTQAGENASGVQVELFRDEVRLATVITDAFGDFRFSNIASGVDDYVLRARGADGAAGEAFLAGPIVSSRLVAIVLG